MRLTALSLTLKSDFHFASQYLAIVLLLATSNTRRVQDSTALLLSLANKRFAESSAEALQTTVPMANRLTGCSVRLQSLAKLWTTQVLVKTLAEPSLKLNDETTSWLRFVCQSTVSRPVNSLCKVLFQLSLTVLVCYRCRSRIA